MLPPSAPVSPQRLRRTLQPHLEAAARLPGLDHYRKVFPALAHLWILIFHVLDGAPSLRQTHARLRLRDRLWQAWGMPRFISHTQLSRSSKSRPPAGAEHLLARLFAQAMRRPVQDPDARLLLRIEAVDSTFIRLSEQLAPWAKHGKAAAGVFVQCGLDLARELPTWLVLHGRDANDRVALAERDLTPLAGWTVIVDKGYYGHKLFAALLAAGVDFITRRYEPARVTAVRTYDVVTAPLRDGIRLMSDQVIELGSPNNRDSVVVPNLRLIRYQTADGEAHEVLTSRHDLTAGEVIALYRKRWRIELFFRLLKRQLGLLRPFGKSAEAVWLTVLLAAIVAVLLVVTEAMRPPDTSQVAWARELSEQLNADLQALRL